MKQITKEQAILIYNSGLWLDWTPEEKVKFQLYQNRLAMPWGEFCGAMNTVLGRRVFTHEYANKEALQAEFEGKVAAPTFEDILKMIPSDKVIIIDAEL